MTNEEDDGEWRPGQNPGNLRLEDYPPAHPRLIDGFSMSRGSGCWPSFFTLLAIIGAIALLIPLGCVLLLWRH